MIKTFRLPDLGEGIHEAEILAIPVTTGQNILEGDPIIEVETDKAAVEIPSPITGSIEKLHVQPGDIANVGDILISFSVTQEAESPTSEYNDDKESILSPNKPKESNYTTDNKLPVPASPSTRKLARELAVDLRLITASGASGIVSADDVRQFAQYGDENATTTPSKSVSTRVTETPIIPSGKLPDFSQFGEIERHDFRSIRRATAKRMSESWSQIPHVNCQDVVDITLLEEFRTRHKNEIAELGGRLTMTVFTLKAVATALKRFPNFNASLDVEQQEIIIKKYFNIGIAMDTPHGLMVPVIRDVDRKSIKELSIELHTDINMARARKLSREKLSGGSFTITNAGAIGGSHFSAIINHPEIAILGLGQARMQPVVLTDEKGKHEIVPRLLMPIILCFDHRVVDGADAIRFLQVIINSLQDPDDLLINMI
ncbi:MAG: pyruvate dehydrogenase E2 component (dihydrolipoamide acetyltransferase) [Desulforhopalus sp.]|jgi:pyruvate dehydrogenase E2 component (dihydrolipoamide acetyltransferase)